MSRRWHREERRARAALRRNAGRIDDTARGTPGDKVKRLQKRREEKRF